MTNQALRELPSSDEINAELTRIIASPEFCVPERGRSFLRYIVGETVAGRGDRLKAYGIALAVFARSDAFDAQNDPVVRIEAGRLRRALERYYLVAGSADEILIDIPKGGYRPTFTVRKRTVGARWGQTHWLAHAARLAIGMALIAVAFWGADMATTKLSAHNSQQALAVVAAPCKNEVAQSLDCEHSGR